MRWVILAGWLLSACAPEPLTAAEELCRVRVLGVVEAGECDNYVDLDDCPAYRWAMRECGALLRAASEAE